MSAQNEICVGIDLGTTNSCAAYYLNGSVRILENRDGDRITASYVYFSETGKPIVGKYAKEKAGKDPDNGIYEIKRLIGRKLSDPKVKENIKNLYYRIDSANQKDEILVLIKHDQLITKKKTPIEISTTILSKMKSDIDYKQGRREVIKAVITVPAYFNVSQRKDTLEAATRAGFDVLKLLNEPTAAAFSFFLNNDTHLVNDHFLVYDLGGGTFDVAVLKKTETNIEIIAVDGDTHLGGHDFDNLIVKYVRKILKEKYNFDSKLNKSKLKLLQETCEAAKRKLIHFEKSEITLTSFIPGHDEIEIDLTRVEFDKMANKLFRKTIDIVNNCLISCNLAKEKIKQVILAGGSTRILKIQEMLCEYFNRDCLNRNNHFDECVAEGAAIQAAMLSSNPRQKIKSFSITDVTPLSLGVCTIANLMSVCIAKHTRIPFEVTKSFSTTSDKQNTINFDLYEGERSDARKNHYLGEFTLSNLTPTPPGECQIMLTMKIDGNGILTVTAQETTQNNVKTLSVVYARGRRNDELKEAEQNKLEDQKFVKFAKLKEYLLLYCEGVKYNLLKKGLHRTHEDIFDLCEILREGGSHIEVVDKKEVEDSIDLIESKCRLLVRQYNFELMPRKRKYLVRKPSFLDSVFVKNN